VIFEGAAGIAGGAFSFSARRWLRVAGTGITVWAIFATLGAKV
jgi:hypothetical protein